MATPEVRNYDDYKEEDVNLKKLSTEIQEGKTSGETPNDENSDTERTNLDQTKDKVDEKKLADFKLKAEYLQQYWWDEYKQIVNNVMSQFDRDIKKILDKSSDDDKNVKEVKFENITTKTDTQLEEEAGEVMNQQPGKFEAQKAMINKIYAKWSAEDIKLLNEIIDKYMKEVDAKYQKFISSEARG